MAKLSDSFTLNRGANNAPPKLSDTFTIKSNNTSSNTLSDTFTVAKPKVEQTSQALYTSKKNNFEVTDDTLNKWLSADYKLTDEDKKQAREFIQKVDKTNLNRKNKETYNADLRNKINYLNSKAYGGAFASGLMEGINPFYDTVRDKIASDEDKAMYEGIKGQSKGAYTVGKLAGTAMDYALAGKIPGVQKLGSTIGQGLGGSKIANAIGGITADTLVDIGLDTIPEAVGNITDGKSLDEIATDASKNIKNNVLFNVGGELISNVPNVIKGIKQSRADRIAELAKEADLNAFDAGKATRKANTENAFNEILENSRNALKDADVANQNDAIAKRILEEQNATKETDLGELLAQARREADNVPIESGDINIDELLGVPVLNAPNRGDIVNTLNPYELVGATERQARKANNLIIPSLVEDTKNVDVPVKSVAENVGTPKANVANNQTVENAEKLVLGDTPKVNATNESIALNSGELNTNRYSNVTIPNKTDMPDVLKDEFKENPQFYEVLKNKNTSDKATEILANNDLNEAYRQFGDLLSKRDPVAVPLGYDIAKQMVESGNTEGAVKVVEELSSALTSSGQFTQAAAIRMLKSDPMAAMRLMQKDIDKINANGLKKYKGKWVDFALTEDEINAFSKIAPGDTQAIQNLFEQITRRMADSYPSTTWEKIVEATKTAMMLNPRTHIRNVAANTAMMPVRSLTDRVSALGQNIYHLINPDFKVTQSLTGGTSQQKKIANDIFDEQIKPLLEGGNKWEDVVDNVARNKQVFSDSKLGTAIKKGTKNTLDKLANSSLNTLTNGRIAKLAEQMDESMTGSVMENLRKFDYYLLGAVEDDPFVKSNFTNRLASYMKAQGINAVEDVPNEAIQTAYQEALKATFKDENYMTKMFKGIKNSTGKFGEVLLPFVKTPANLAKRGIEYSPIGFVDTLLHSNGKQTAEIIDDLAKNVTGTAGIVLGYELAKRGLIQGALSSDKDTQAFEKQQGKQAFSINVNGNYYTFDWAQPASIPLVIGTTIYDAIKESDEENANYLDLAKQSLTASVDAWADLSPISSLQDILGGSEYSSGSIGENIVNEVTEFPQRLIPSLSGAIARTADTTYRQTYSKNNPWQTWLDTAKAKIPGLSQTLPASYDTWGNERKRQDSTGSAAIAQFINPGTLGYDASTPIDGEIQRLYESVGSNSVFPNKASWSVGDKTLTNEEYSNYQKSMGEKSYDMANAFINSSLYNSIDDSERANILSKLYSVAKSISENELFGKEIGNSNAKVSEIYKSEGAEGVIKYYQKKNDFDSLGVSLNSSEANAIYDSEGMQGLRNYAQTKQTIEDSGLKYSEKTVDTYNNYGVDGLNILSSIADTGSKNGNNILPVLESANLSDAEIGQWLATTANLTKTGQMFADSGAYEALATYYRIRKNADLDGNGSVKKDELIPYLESVGLDTDTWGKLTY